ncbi:MAG: hypothetical protein K1X35_02685 [Caulobacteraceae bacterium]|nr:hypothetical protein [Caulobacteraceae bacterium]
MNFNRRSIFTGAAAVIAGAAAVRANAQVTPAATGPAPSVQDRLVALARANRHALAYDGRAFSGAGWELLVAEGARAKFFMLGEEHGIAENAALAGQLVETLAPMGYSRMAIEISPPIAQEMDAALNRGGLDGLRRYYSQNQLYVAFYTMAEEAMMLARARKALPRGEDVLWGLDYEVGADRRLVQRLKTAPKPAAARGPMTALLSASIAAHADYQASHNPAKLFSFGGDPRLVRDLMAAWPHPDPQSAWILDTLLGTLEANNLWIQGREWESNQRRAALMRANWNRHWQALGPRARSTRAFFKFGASHVIRGRNLSQVFDMGSLVHETAALEGKSAFNIFVVGGKGGVNAQFNPVEWRYAPGQVSDAADENITFLTDQAFDSGFTVIDLRPLRPILTHARTSRSDPRWSQIVHGFDALVVMPGCHASLNL